LFRLEHDVPEYIYNRLQPHAAAGAVPKRHQKARIVTTMDRHDAWFFLLFGRRHVRARG
jgi:hypothetical protein